MGKNIFIVCKDGDALMDVDRTVPGLEAVIGANAKMEIYGLPDTQVGYKVENVSEEAIRRVREHPAVQNVYDGPIPLEHIKSYGDAGLQAGATVWNAKFGQVGYSSVIEKEIDARFMYQ